VDKVMSEKDDRKELLLKMYDQMFNDIDTHILVVWQSVTVLVGAFAIFALTEKKIISLDITVSLILLLCGWLIAHIYDAGYWYNRNLAIIANIEKQYLDQSDLRSVHYYFGRHRHGNKMITHLRIQYALGVGIGLIVLAFHFLTEIWPRFSTSFHDFKVAPAMPYGMSILIALYLWNLAARCERKYKEFLKNSPGKEIDTTGIDYGEGHGFTDFWRKKFETLFWIWPPK
jgi:hypothetical protein